MREAGNLIAVLEQSPGESSPLSLTDLSLNLLKYPSSGLRRGEKLFYLLLILYAKQE